MQIPDDKKYFRIGEVSRIIGVRPYVLRYWESEFPQIRPHRADSNQRTYQKKDLEKIFEIREAYHRRGQKEAKRGQIKPAPCGKRALERDKKRTSRYP
jgi:hypothetical protein